MNKALRLKIREFAEENYAEGKPFNEMAFREDYSRFLTTKKIVSRFLRSDSVNDHLLINNLICIINVFGVSKTNAIFRALCTNVQFSVIKAFLMFIGKYDPEVGFDIYPNRIAVDILRHRMAHRYDLSHHKE